MRLVGVSRGAVEDGIVTGFCSISAIAWGRATLHKNFEKCFFSVFGRKRRLRVQWWWSRDLD